MPYAHILDDLLKSDTRHSEHILKLITDQPRTLNELCQLTALDSRDVMGALQYLRSEQLVGKEDDLMNGGRWYRVGQYNPAQKRPVGEEANPLVSMGCSLDGAGRVM